MPIMVFDIETVPDVETGGRLHKLEGLSQGEIAELMFSQRRQETHGNSDFLSHYLHRIVSIAVLLRQDSGELGVWSLGQEDSGEQELIQQFFKGLEQYQPILVSWNGSGFDLPVLHYRSLLHGVASPMYWDTGSHNRDFRWNNYQSRYHSRHTDLMDVLSCYSYQSRAPLDKLSFMLGFPGKMGLGGAQVWDYYQQGDLAKIRNYCETDVLNTYLVYLRYDLIRGELSAQEYEHACDDLAGLLERKDAPHLREFLQAWRP